MEQNGNLVGALPAKTRRIHLVGVGGTGMGSFAGMLKAAGYEVSGSDENLYPPMSDMLAAWGIRAMTPYAASNLELAKPDLVIIGNVIRRINPEATAVRERGLPTMSFPQALGELFLRPRKSLVVAGTHGKTTTSALLGHVLVEAGADPTFLVGGVTHNYAGNYRLGRGPHFVVEGDEYDTAYFDKGPKFLHYQPQTLVLTSIELDHADIYRDEAHYEEAFTKLVALVPYEGTIAVSAAWPNAVRVAKSGVARVVTYGEGGEVHAKGLELGSFGARFEIIEGSEPCGRFELPLAGAHNVENALGVFVACRAQGLSNEAIALGFRSFKGVKRRQEERGEPGGVLVIDDFAHHPTAVKETVRAIVGRYPGRRVLAVFEPRSNTSRRNLHQHEYAVAFGGAARAFLRVPQRHDKVPESEALDVTKLTQELTSAGIAAYASSHVQEIVEAVKAEARPGDVVLVMSNGSFDGFIPLLMERLRR